MAILGYFSADTAEQPKADNIVCISPATWSGTFAGKKMKYQGFGNTVATTSFAFSGGDPGWYYTKGVAFTDLVHYHEVIPPGRWVTRIWAKYTSDIDDADEWLSGGIYIWRGATDSLKEIVGAFTFPIASTAAAYEPYIDTDEPIVLYPGDRIAVEFWGELHLYEITLLIKWNISIYYNHATRDSYLTYPKMQRTGRILNGAEALMR